MNHQGLRWNVHCVANVALRIRLNLYKRGFKIYDLLVLYVHVTSSVKSRRDSRPFGVMLEFLFFFSFQFIEFKCYFKFVSI